MAYYSYLNMGIAYHNECNYFNAIEAYKTSIYKEELYIKGLNNLGVTLSQVGLQKRAITKFNGSILNLKPSKSEPVKDPWKEYSNRAGLLRILGKEKEMFNDIEMAFHYKKNLSSAWIEMAKFHMQKCEFDEARLAFDKAIEFDSTKPYFWLTRGTFFQIIGEYDKALMDIDKANQLSTKKANTLYELGKAYYLKGDKNQSEECYLNYLNKGEWRVKYEESEFQYGIVQFVDQLKGFGFILGKTFFNNYDNIYFRLSDCKTKINKGDRVRFTSKYKQYKGQYSANAKNIELSNTIIDLNFKKQNVYHAMISVKQNSFKSAIDNKYIELFYPYKAILPIASVEKLIDEGVGRSG